MIKKAIFFLCFQTMYFGVFGTTYDAVLGDLPDTCHIKMIYDTGNMNGVFISWRCADSLGLGTVNNNGTPGTHTDDTFVAPAGTAMGMTNNGSVTYWKFPNVKVCATDSDGNMCCATAEVRVVKNKVGNNGVFWNKGVLDKNWINAVKACSKGGGNNLVVKWNGIDYWTLTPPKKCSTNGTDSQTGTVKTIYDNQLQSPNSIVTLPMIISSLSEWTIIPYAIATQLGLVPLTSIDISGSDTYTALLNANMNQSNQTIFDVAYLPILNTGISQHNGQVLISNDINSDFGILGGSFLYNITYTFDESENTDCFAVVYALTNIPTLSEWGLIILALLGLSVGMAFIRRREPAVAMAGARQIKNEVPIFNKMLYIKTLGGVLLLAAIGLSLSVLWYGYLTATDFWGTIISSFIVAYIAQLWLLKKRI